MAEVWIEYDGGAVQDNNARRIRTPGVTLIPRGALIRVAANVDVVPEGAFERCYNLRAVDLNNVATISDWAFSNCRSLEHIIWPTATPVEIGESAFAACSSLKEIDLSSAIKIGPGAFANCEALTRVVVPSSVVEIEEGVFEDCRKLKQVELSEGIHRIGGSAFRGCTSLASINIPSTTLEIEDYAFAGCDLLRSVELREGLQMIGTGAFWNCRSLERVTVPSSVTDIGKFAFGRCENLAEVTLCEGIYDIEGDALDHITIPPASFVIGIEKSSCRIMRGRVSVTPGRKLVITKWMQYRSPSQLTRAKVKVREILGRIRQPEGQKIALIREWFAYCDMLDVTTMLELAIWRCNMNGNERDADARQDSRQNCGSGMNVIIPGVLPFLEG